MELITKPMTPLKDDLLTVDQMAERYMAYMRDMAKKRFTTGMGLIDEAIRGVAPGEVLTIIAYSGTYKSAYLQNLLLQAGYRSQTHQMFFSMEMPAEKCFERAVQMAGDVTGYDVERNFKANNEIAQVMLENLRANGGKFLLTCEKSRLSIDKIGRYIEYAQSKYDHIGSVGIDYLGLLKAEGISMFEKVETISFEIKDLAKRLNVPIILLGQVNRGYAQSQDKEIEMDAAKGGGGVESGADFMFGLFKKEDELLLKILKNRNGKNGDIFKINLNPSSLRFEGVEEWKQPEQESGQKKKGKLGASQPPL